MNYATAARYLTFTLYTNEVLECTYIGWMEDDGLEDIGWDYENDCPYACGY
jgi:hypothetical protein